MNKYSNKLRKLRCEFKYRTFAKVQAAMDWARYRSARRIFLPELITEFSFDSAMVFAPHPDDEIIGPGGTLCLAARQYIPIIEVVFTDGSAGLSPEIPESELAAQRKAEVQAVAEFIGLKKVIFLDYPDQNLKKTPQSTEKVKELLREYRPGAVFLPFIIDYHWDHVQSNRIVVEAAGGLDYEPEFWCYEASAPILPNVIVNISEVIELKKQAIAMYASQQATNDYIYTIAEGLNRFRAFGIMKGSGYAEGFYRTNLAYMQQLVDDLEGVL